MLTDLLHLRVTTLPSEARIAIVVALAIVLVSGVLIASRALRNVRKVTRR
jgi:ABC-type antimicrobial peptide transport system permease subunit